MALHQSLCSSEFSSSSSLLFTPESSSATVSTTPGFHSLSVPSAPELFFKNVTPGSDEQSSDSDEKSCPVDVGSTGEVLQREAGSLESLETDRFLEFNATHEKIQPQPQVDRRGKSQEQLYGRQGSSSEDLRQELLSSHSAADDSSDLQLSEYQKDVESVVESTQSTFSTQAGASPSTSYTSPPSLLSKPIFIRCFYPIDPVTFIQQQDPVYNDPQCPVVQPIPEWPPPELVEWRRGRRKGPNSASKECENFAGKKRKADESSEDEEYRPNFPSFHSGRASKRVRWRSVDDIAPESFFRGVTPITVNPKDKPFVSLPSQGSIDKSLYRAVSVPPLSPSPSDDDEDETLLFGRGRRPRPSKYQSRHLSLSFGKDEFKPSRPRLLKSNAERTCHQCRRSDSLTVPKMKCSFTKSNGQPCAFQFCSACIANRYDEPFEASTTTWTCPFCRGICNCSLCIRQAGFGYIFDGPLAEDMKQGKLRRGQPRTKGRNAVNPPSSLRKWFARHGVITGSTTWMSQRRKEGIRFVVGRSPSPGLDSFIPVEDCEFLQQFEKNINGIEDAERTDTSSEQAFPINLAGSSSSPPPSNSAYEIFAPLNLRRKTRFFIGNGLKRRTGPHEHAKLSLGRKSSTVTPRRESPSAEDNARKNDRPQAMRVLRPSVKKSGFYAELHEGDAHEEEAESKTEAAKVTVPQYQLGPEPALPEFTLSYSTTLSVSTSDSTALSLNTQGLVHEKSLADNENRMDIGARIANWPSVAITEPPADNQPKTSAHSSVTGPARMPLDHNIENDFTLPLPDIYTFTVPDSLSGLDSWFVASGPDAEGDIDAAGETDTGSSSGVCMDEGDCDRMMTPMDKQGARAGTGDEESQCLDTKTLTSSIDDRDDGAH